MEKVSTVKFLGKRLGRDSNDSDVHLGTVIGTVTFLEPVKIHTSGEDQLSAANSCCCSTGPSEWADTVCITSVPAFMIPDEFLEALSSILMVMKSLEIYRALDSGIDNGDFYIAIATMNSAEDATRFVRSFHGLPMATTLETAVWAIYPISNLSFAIAESSVQVLSRSISPRAQSRCGSCETLPQSLPTDNLLFTGAGVISTSASDAQDANHHQLHQHGHRDELCVVCLEPIDPSNPRAITIFCGHTFHFDCAMRMESSQCPICRYEHESASRVLTKCTQCEARARALTSAHGHGQAPIPVVPEGVCNMLMMLMNMMMINMMMNLSMNVCINMIMPMMIMVMSIMTTMMI